MRDLKAPAARGCRAPTVCIHSQDVATILSSVQDQLCECRETPMCRHPGPHSLNKVAIADRCFLVADSCMAWSHRNGAPSVCQWTKCTPQIFWEHFHVPHLQSPPGLEEARCVAELRSQLHRTCDNCLC